MVPSLGWFLSSRYADMKPIYYKLSFGEWFIFLKELKKVIKRHNLILFQIDHQKEEHVEKISIFYHFRTTVCKFRKPGPSHFWSKKIQTF